VSETTERTTATLQIGQWHDDGWISPYLRMRFQAPSDNPKLVLSVYCPDAEAKPSTLAVRQGAGRLLLEETLPRGEMVTLSASITASRGSEVDISLRTDQPFDPSGEDKRKIAVVLTEWRLDAGQTDNDNKD
jgi:hypothetical protein